MKAKALGELKKITIRHDNKGNDPSWYLEKVRSEAINSLTVIDNKDTDRIVKS